MYNKKHTTANFLTTLLSTLSLFTKASIPTANKAIAKAKKAQPSHTTIYPSSHHLKPRLHAHRKAADNALCHLSAANYCVVIFRLRICSDYLSHRRCAIRAR